MLLVRFLFFLSISTCIEMKNADSWRYWRYLGGSTIVFLFEKGRVNWDEDLLTNGRGCLETLVRVGMGIGRGHQVEEGCLKAG